MISNIQQLKLMIGQFVDKGKRCILCVSVCLYIETDTQLTCELIKYRERQTDTYTQAHTLHVMFLLWFCLLLSPLRSWKKRC